MMTNEARETFFKELAINSSISDLELVKKVYSGLLKTIGRNLKKNGEYEIPNFGKFYLHVFSSKRLMSVYTREMIVSPKIKILEFTPSKALKRFVKNL